MSCAGHALFSTSFSPTQEKLYHQRLSLPAQFVKLNFAQLVPLSVSSLTQQPSLSSSCARQCTLKRHSEQVKLVLADMLRFVLLPKFVQRHQQSRTCYNHSWLPQTVPIRKL
jgi:hypothetical protein